MTAAKKKTAEADVAVRASPEGIERLVRGSTVVIEEARGPSYLGATGQPLGFWNLTTCAGRQPLAQSESSEALRKWALAQGARRAEVLS